MVGNQLKVLKELIELLKWKFDTLPTVEINSYQYNLENVYTLPTINWSFLIDDWAININTPDILKNKELYVAVQNRAYRIFCRNVIPFKEIKQELCSSQEADIKMFLSTSFIMSLGFGSVCIATNDADKLALGSYYSQKLASKLYIDMLLNSKRLCNFGKIKLNQKLCDAMPSFHAVTGSNFTSSFHGLGKTKGLNLLRKNDVFSDAFILLGEEANLNERTIKVIERFLCEFYGKQNTVELNAVLNQLFCGEKKSPVAERTLGIVLYFNLSVQIM